MSNDRFHEQLYSKFVRFFDDAEEKRRWNPLRDVPWDKIEREAPEELAVCAETFLGVESFLPDYISGGLGILRASSVGQRWFSANWGYEELKHSMALMEYLIRSGKRTQEQMFDFQARLMTESWSPPFATPRQMTIYGMLQEMATFVIYLRHEKLAKEHGDEALATIYRLNARDECAHARFYEDVVRVYLEEDRHGTLLDIAHVAKNFEMPGVGIVPDYDARIEVMREHGRMDRDVFFKKVYFPLLGRLDVTRAELVEAAATARKQRRIDAASAAAE
ncbi:MAG: acyl-ACP desaturase [Polyangiaceae bacterium]|nr:acyl-ACP desaturase [Polyangiaceae bacterium]